MPQWEYAQIYYELEGPQAGASKTEHRTWARLPGQEAVLRMKHTLDKSVTPSVWKSQYYDQNSKQIQTELSLIDLMNELGQQGWELALLDGQTAALINDGHYNSVPIGQRWIFKRQVGHR